MDKEFVRRYIREALRLERPMPVDRKASVLPEIERRITGVRKILHGRR
jgi:hypothetical protein